MQQFFDHYLKAPRRRVDGKGIPYLERESGKKRSMTPSTASRASSAHIRGQKRGESSNPYRIFADTSSTRSAKRRAEPPSLAKMAPDPAENLERIRAEMDVERTDDEALPKVGDQIAAIESCQSRSRGMTRIASLSRRESTRTRREAGSRRHREQRPSRVPDAFTTGQSP